MQLLCSTVNNIDTANILMVHYWKINRKIHTGWCISRRLYPKSTLCTTCFSIYSVYSI